MMSGMMVVAVAIVLPIEETGKRKRKENRN